MTRQEPMWPRAHIGELRIEHHAANGAVRLLAGSCLPTIAISAALTGALRLGRSGHDGQVLVIEVETGAVKYRRAVSNDPP